jgi:hypothetical protein
LAACTAMDAATDPPGLAVTTHGFEATARIA